MTHTIDIDSIIRNAQEAVEAEQLDDGKLYGARNSDGDYQLVITPGYIRAVERDEAEGGPVQIKRAVTVRDDDALVDYLAHNTLGDFTGVDRGYRHGPGDLELWADLDRRNIKAILDGGSGHRAHTATLDLRHSEEWAEWAQVDGKLFGQVEFAQFIEDHISSIAAPDGGVLLDIVQTLEARTDVRFKSSQLLGNGQRQIAFEETLDAKAGAKGDLKIPTELTLALRPFQGCEPVAVIARFRFRINDGVLRMGVKLAEPNKALEAAFADIVANIQALVPVRVNHGVG